MWRLLFRVGWGLLVLIGLARNRRALPHIPNARRRASDAITAVRLGIRTVAAAVLAGFAVIAATAAITLAGPGPRWLAVGFAFAAVLTAYFGVTDVRHLRREVRIWRAERNGRPTLDRAGGRHRDI